MVWLLNHWNIPKKGKALTRRMKGWEAPGEGYGQSGAAWEVRFLLLKWKCFNFFVPGYKITCTEKEIQTIQKVINT